MPHALIISISSDIGAALGERLQTKGWTVHGTYRIETDRLAKLRRPGLTISPLEVTEPDEISRMARELTAQEYRWDALVICHATLEPIGPFASGAMEAWERSLDVNFTSAMRLVHDLLPLRNSGTAPEPMVLLFAGGGTNGAPPNFSAYTVSKIALIKMCELLQAEIPDTRFTILGPGWVQTKIHQQTLQAGATQAADAYEKTKAMLSGGQGWVSMNQVLDCCEWALTAPKEVVGGRNFSVAHDAWQKNGLNKVLRSDSDLYKLRRSGNDLRVP
jgi:NAD(P)-dependent dehydrogenase (short-subunit alcohol dehydrogenase family)